MSHTEAHFVQCSHTVQCTEFLSLKITVAAVIQHSLSILIVSIKHWGFTPGGPFEGNTLELQTAHNNSTSTCTHIGKHTYACTCRTGKKACCFFYWDVGRTLLLMWETTESRSCELSCTHTHTHIRVQQVCMNLPTLQISRYCPCKLGSRESHHVEVTGYMMNFKRICIFYIRLFFIAPPFISHTHTKMNT